MARTPQSLTITTGSNSTLSIPGEESLKGINISKVDVGKPFEFTTALDKNISLGEVDEIIANENGGYTFRCGENMIELKNK